MKPFKIQMIRNDENGTISHDSVSTQSTSQIGTKIDQGPDLLKVKVYGSRQIVQPLRFWIKV